MPSRVCPDCDFGSDAILCPKCGHRTMRERKAGDVVDPMIGTDLDGRYRIDSIIGRGGMGSVYRGLQLATGQTVAIKVIRAESAENMEAAKRFHREARAASLLTHPHTIRVFDFGESEQGDLYMVLEFLAGRTLGKVIRADGCMPEQRVAKIGCEIAQSLSEAHSTGLAHRDLKPENIMLVDAFGDPDFVKVLDFGIAKFLSGSSGESAVTRTGAVVGTPHCMAPEQATGSRALTPAVDMYALGVMLFESVCGFKPFDGDSPLNILMAHVRDPVPELPGECAVSIGFRGLVRRMLDKEPSRRPSAPEAAREMERMRLHAMFSGATREKPPVLTLNTAYGPAVLPTEVESRLKTRMLTSNEVKVQTPAPPLVVSVETPVVADVDTGSDVVEPTGPQTRIAQPALAVDPVALAAEGEPWEVSSATARSAPWWQWVLVTLLIAVCGGLAWWGFSVYVGGSFDFVASEAAPPSSPSPPPSPPPSSPPSPPAQAPAQIVPANPAPEPIVVPSELRPKASEPKPVDVPSKVGISKPVSEPAAGIGPAKDKGVRPRPMIVAPKEVHAPPVRKKPVEKQDSYKILD